MSGNKILTKEEIDVFQLKRHIISLYKAFLIILEDLEEDHIENFEKLYESLHNYKDLVRQADYFTEEKMSYLRKKVLDAGNNCIRNITGEKNGKAEESKGTSSS